MSANQLKIPTPERMEKLFETIANDEDFRFPTIKLNRDKPRHEIPAPTDQDPDAVNSVPTFTAVILHFTKFIQKPTEEDLEKNPEKEPQEKRKVWILRPGRITPEVIYVSPSATRGWKSALLQAQDSGFSPMCGFWMEFGAERIKGKKFTWNAPTFKVGAVLSEAEQDYARKLAGVIKTTVRRYDVDPRAESLEDSLLNDGPDAAETQARKQARTIDEEEEPAATPPKAAATKPPKAAAKPATAAAPRQIAEEDDEDIASIGAAGGSPSPEEEEE